MVGCRRLVLRLILHFRRLLRLLILRLRLELLCRFRSGFGIPLHNAFLRNRPPHRDQLLSCAFVAELGDPTLQAWVRTLVRDFRQEHGIGVRILHGRHRGIEIDHHDLLISCSVNIVLNAPITKWSI